MAPPPQPSNAMQGQLSSMPPGPPNLAYYPPPPASMQPQQQQPYSGVPPPPIAGHNPYGSLPPTAPSQPPSAPAIAGLPPNILALLQQQAAAPVSIQPQQPPPPTGAYGMVPPLPMIPTTAPPATGTSMSPPQTAPLQQPSYQQLMAYLVSSPWTFSHGSFTERCFEAITGKATITEVIDRRTFHSDRFCSNFCRVYALHY
jgi:hypothetical protein